MSTLVPIVIEKTGRGERAYDIFSRLLTDRIVFVGGAISDELSNAVIARFSNSKTILRPGDGGQDPDHRARRERRDRPPPRERVPGDPGDETFGGILGLS